jgi:hypothetical protein
MYSSIVTEPALAVSALPQHEIADPLLARGTDDQVGVGLATGIEMVGDHLGGEQVGQLFEAAALLAVAAQDAAHRVRDLAPPAVPDGEVDVQPGVCEGARLRTLERLSERVGQAVGSTDVLHTPPALVREVLGELGDDFV